MNPVTIVFGIQRVRYCALALIAWTVLLFCAGYLSKGYRDSVADAKVEAKQEAVSATVKAAAVAIDDQALTRLKTALAGASTRAATLEHIIKEQSNATPATAICRLPDGLRDQINLDLATGTP